MGITRSRLEILKSLLQKINQGRQPTPLENLERMRNPWSSDGMSVCLQCVSPYVSSCFPVKIAATWNQLPENIVSAGTVNTFQNRLDKFWITNPPSTTSY
ncbi:hypothetical protein FHG87_004219 [Trinorchestia longiramus]|nr:hypothetical protein FHG87_004219 [Trinorchestia longiramus]